jgi:hypothetical protein
MAEEVAKAEAEVWAALYDEEDPRRREWAADRILGSWMARDHPLAKARPSPSAPSQVTVKLEFRFEEKQEVPE